VRRTGCTPSQWAWIRFAGQNVKSFASHVGP